MRVGLDWSEVQEFGLWCGLVFGLHEHEMKSTFFCVGCGGVGWYGIGLHQYM